MGLVEDKKITDISIPGIQKERFRINGDNNKILELNTSDANVIVRLQEGYNKLLELAQEVSSLADGLEDTEAEESLNTMSKRLKELDNKMREQLDYIFDSNVSEVCAGNASMYDPKEGKFRFEHIIDAIGSLYSDSFSKEFAKMKQRVDEHTSKYTRKTKKGK